MSVRSSFRVPAWPWLGLLLSFLAIPMGQAHADLTVNNIGLYDGTSNAPTAWISYSGSGGSIDVYADPQTATNWTSNGSPVSLYCFDLIHDNSLGDNYGVSVESSPTFSTTPSDTDAANRVAWALENAGSTATARGATQLLIWSIVDTNFTVNWTETNDDPLHTAYNNLVSAMGAGYAPRTNYLPGAEFLGAVHDPSNTLYQDLALAIPPGFHTNDAVAPEPSSLVIAGLGTLGLIGYGWCRRGLPRRRSGLVVQEP
jgi:hypothetical protein